MRCKTEGGREGREDGRSSSNNPADTTTKTREGAQRCPSGVDETCSGDDRVLKAGGDVLRSYLGSSSSSLGVQPHSNSFDWHIMQDSRGCVVMTIHYTPQVHFEGSGIITVELIWSCIASTRCTYGLQPSMGDFKYTGAVMATSKCAYSKHNSTWSSRAVRQGHQQAQPGMQPGVTHGPFRSRSFTKALNNGQEGTHAVRRMALLRDLLRHSSAVHAHLREDCLPSLFNVRKVHEHRGAAVAAVVVPGSKREVVMVGVILLSILLGAWISNGKRAESWVTLVIIDQFLRNCWAHLGCVCATARRLRAESRVIRRALALLTTSFTELRVLPTFLADSLLQSRVPHDI